MTAKPSFNQPFLNCEAERACLGAMLRDRSVIGTVLQILLADDFGVDAHQRIFNAIVDLYDLAKPVDIVTVANQLHAVKAIEDLGGYGLLGELWDAAPTSACAEYYAGIVREMALLRQLSHVGHQIARNAAERVDDPYELLSKAEAMIFALANRGVGNKVFSLVDLCNDALQRLDDRCDKARRGVRAAGIPTGFRDLDRITGGLRDGELIIIAARPSVGKTSLLTGILHNVCECEMVAALLISLEQPKEEIADRLLVMVSETDGRRFQDGRLNPEEEDRIPRAANRLRTLFLHVAEEGRQSLLQIASLARQRKLQNKISLLAIDYLQLIDPDDERIPRHEQVGRQSRRLKQLARELRIPVVVLAQVNRMSENRPDKRPKLSDLRESGTIEQDADVVILLHRPEEETDSPRVIKIEAAVAKNRNGMTGVAELVFHKASMRFGDCERNL